MIPDSKPSSTFGTLPGHLQVRLDSIIQNMPQFWEQKRYNHFTNHSPAHSERVQRLLAQLVQELPDNYRLTSDEIFIVSAAAWLYEIGMQSPILKPVLDFEYHGIPLSQEHLSEIRNHKHLLSQELILQSLGDDYKGTPVPLGLQRPLDNYTLLIAEICRWCSNEPLDKVPESDMVNGIPVRIRLLVALLRLADQLYIDSPHVNLEILENANLPKRDFARWWAYHYTSVLPIVNGQIRFNYFLPSHQREFIGHIRALIEPDFEFDRNPTIQYLGVSFHLRLLPPGKPSISRLNTTPGFLRPMSDELTVFMRHKIELLPTEMDASEPEEIETPKDRCLLVLDYENFVLQLGQEGYFLSKDEIVQHAVKLNNLAVKEFRGRIIRVAIGHWQRPDLSQIAKTLEARVYDLESVKQTENSLKKTSDVLSEYIQGTIKPKRIILISPSVDLARSVEQLVDKGFQVAIWANETADVDVYRGGLGNDYRPLRSILQLSNLQSGDPSQFDSDLAACILKIQEGIHQQSKKTTALHLDELFILLAQNSRITEQVDWWVFTLFQKGILISTQTNQDSFCQIDLQHHEVKRLFEMRQLVIETMKTKTADQDGVQEDMLLGILRDRNNIFFKLEQQTRGFLEALKGVEVLRRSTRGGITYWILNPAENVDQYLPRFILSVDHISMREGFYGLHEHSLEKFINNNYLDSNIINSVYRKAIEYGFIQVRETERNSRGEARKVKIVTLDEMQPKVGQVLRNRNIILNFIAYNTGSEGLSRGELFDRLINQRKVFDLTREEFDSWLNIMLHDNVITETETPNNKYQVVKLCFDTLLTQRLFGRMYLCETVRSLRRLRATSPASKCKESELVAKLKPSASNHAQSAVDYSKYIKLILFENSTVDGQNQNFVWLNRHSFVWHLDQREETVLTELAKLISQNADRNGWIPTAVIYSKLDDNIVFGYARQEQDYWVDTALWRKVIQMEKRPDRGWCFKVTREVGSKA